MAVASGQVRNPTHVKPTPTRRPAGSRRPALSRRALVAGLVVGAPVAGLVLVDLARRPRGVRLTAVRVFRASAFETRTIERISRAYLASDAGARASASRLARTLAAQRDPRLARRLLAAVLDKAWRASDIVIADGWVLARPEADLCVLAAG